MGKEIWKTCSSCHDFRSLVVGAMFSNLTSNNVDFILIDAVKKENSEQWAWKSEDFVDTRYVQCTPGTYRIHRIRLLSKPFIEFVF